MKATNEFTPIMQQYLDIKANYQDAVLFFRMGDFYELFFDDAIVISKLLNLTLTKRGKHNGKDIPMAGFPCHVLNTYVKRAVEKNKKVAICEQFDNNKKNGLIERRVVALISPGTLISEDYLKDAKHNYISCIFCYDGIYSISSLDLSAGSFITRVFTDKRSLFDEIESILPVEVIVSDKSHLSIHLNKNYYIQNISNVKFNYKFAISILEKNFKLKRFNYLNLLNYKASVITAGCLLDYVSVYKKNLRNIISINFIDLHGNLDIDLNSKKNLEIFKNFNGDKNNTLIKNIDLTSTAMGKRLLQRRLHLPIISRNILNNRKTAVSILKKNAIFMEIEKYLSSIHDLERIIGRIILNSAKPYDLKRLQLSLNAIDAIRHNLSLLNLNELLSTILFNISSSEKVLNLLKRAIVDIPSSSIKDGCKVIRDGFDSKLDSARSTLNNRSKLILEYQETEQRKTGIPGLQIEFKTRLGFYIDLSNRITNIPNDYILVKKLSNKNRYISDTTKHLEKIFQSAVETVYLREKKIYTLMLYLAGREVKAIQNTAEHLAELDVLTSFAKQSASYNWCEPELIDDCKLEIIGARHPVIEKKMLGSFIPNDITLDSKKKIFIITGANMGGKSTYMRQVGIITLLAHIGSHVPAKRAIIGNFDKILTRMGASDDLPNACSTFMLEMKEISYILEKATDKSLVLIDEIGRGTGHREGKALAAAILNEFIKKKSYVLFSTHFDDLGDVFSKHSQVENIHPQVFYIENKLIFIYKFNKGVSENNFAIEVAEMAGLSNNVINDSRTYLNKFKLDENYYNKKIVDALNKVNIMSISHKKALQIIRVLKKFKKKPR